MSNKYYGNVLMYSWVGSGDGWTWRPKTYNQVNGRTEIQTQTKPSFLVYR